MILPNGTREEWTLKWAKGRARQCMFGTGWYQLCRAHNFRFRDQFFFFKMQQGQYLQS
uniref:TF-B3 domain-containing protein n=1 Tax=Lotus japonicus TaxID=34305 RepID=I3SIN8_LOTJA|nr:unknown [Lotus japonicus]